MQTLDHFKALLHFYKNQDLKYKTEADKALTIAETYRDAAYKLEDVIDKASKEKV